MKLTICTISNLYNSFKCLILKLYYEPASLMDWKKTTNLDSLKEAEKTSEYPGERDIIYNSNS